MHENVHIDLGNRSYDIIIGVDLLAQSGALVQPFLRRKKVAIITDKVVAGLHLNALLDGLASHGIEAVTLTLPVGEATKSWENIQRSVEWLLAEKIERDDLLIAFGGGVVGDLTGFAAAILRRGIRFVQIPTSLLAQVDSSVGGKTGINHGHIKNFIGSFYNPAEVFICSEFLKTLNEQEFLNGFSEVLKHSLITSQQSLEKLKERAEKILSQDTEVLLECIEESIEI